MRATGFITVVDGPSNRRTVTVAGVVYRAGVDFVVGTLDNTLADVAKSLAICVNTNAYVFATYNKDNFVYATYSKNVVVITARADGIVGNALTLVSDTEALVVSGPVLVGGTDDDNVVVNVDTRMNTTWIRNRNSGLWDEVYTIGTVEDDNRAIYFGRRSATPWNETEWTPPA